MRTCSWARQSVAAGVLLLAPGSSAQVQLLNITSQTAPGLSSTCLSVLNQQVACNATITGLSISGNFRIYSDQFLAGLCTSSCASGLSNWLRRVSGACASSHMPLDATNQTQVIPAYFPERYLELYQQACLPGADGTFCNAALGTAAGINPDNQAMTKTPAASLACTSCYLSLISTQLQQPLASNAALSQAYSSLTSSCQVTSMSTTPLAITTSWFITSSTTSAAVSECSGTTYTVKSGDTCQSVSFSQHISTMSLLTSNNLQAWCYEFPTSGTLCIPSSETCTPYTIKAGDTCASIALAQKTQTSYAQILSWNPSFGGGCGQIGQYVGWTICISAPGGYSGPTATSIPTATTTSYPDTVQWTPFSMLTGQPTMASNVSAAASPTGIAPYANGTRDDCGQYVTAPVLVNNTANLTSNDCATVASAIGVALSDFEAWNSLPSSGCSLTSGYRYCSAPFVAQANSTTTCVQFELPMSGYSCVQFVRQYGLDMSQFVAWNPQVGSDCEAFSMSVSYCIAVLGFRQPGIISNCNKFVMPNDTNWSDGPCTLMETAYGLSHPRFVAWNPAVQQNCTGLYPGYEYCVSIPNYKPTYTTPSPTTFTGPVAPATTGSS